MAEAKSTLHARRINVASRKLTYLQFLRGQYGNLLSPKPANPVTITAVRVHRTADTADTIYLDGATHKLKAVVDG